MNHKSTWWQALDTTQKLTDFAAFLGGPDKPSRHWLVQIALDKNVNEVLDCGSGLCIDAPLFQSHNIRYIGIDSTPRFVNRAVGLGFDVILGDIESLPFANKSLEMVFCRSVLEHLPDFKKPLQEMLRVAHRVVAVTFFNPPAHTRQGIFCVEEMVYSNVYNKKEIEEWCMSQGVFPIWEHFEPTAGAHHAECGLLLAISPPLL
jgi:ubiquinone/menaquinone biosynthesis C-methylase UbiE